ncbi:MAG: RluA family pseudouridine synthase [Spirochaetaceae bacterium]|nr:RluA family pseudouridine synthase [Spirochaetaceae bacterium]
MEEIFALYRVPVLDSLETAETYMWTNPKNGKSYPRYKLRPVIKHKSIFEFYGNGDSPQSDNGSGDKSEDGTQRSGTPDKMPPTGAGECCAPKLIAQAYSIGLRPISLAEFYYGESPLSGEKVHKQFYEPCDEKCGPLLPAMLGLKVLYQDEAIVVVEKPSGLLSVPGRGAEKQDCVVNRVKFLFSHCIEQPSVHRLDMETSGILVLALTDDAHRNLSRQFEEGSVKKQYEAVLDGIPECIKKGARNGRLELPFRLDVENRPRQIYDEVYGKIGITEWEFLRYEKGGRVRLLYTPHTGRTHQLRLHSADEHGLGVPIVGDTLYGKSASSVHERLLLHARILEFTHPITGERMSFTNPAPF